jgi:hypothetical protein
VELAAFLNRLFLGKSTRAIKFYGIMALFINVFRVLCHSYGRLYNVCSGAPNSSITNKSLLAKTPRPPKHEQLIFVRTRVANGGDVVARICFFFLAPTNKTIRYDGASRFSFRLFDVKPALSGD